MSETRIWLVRHGKGRSFWDTYEEARQQQHSAERVGEETELIELAPAARIASLERQLEDARAQLAHVTQRDAETMRTCQHWIAEYNHCEAQLAERTRERDELVNEKKARSKIDPVTRLHNLCDGLAASRRESPYDQESWDLVDAQNKELRARAESAESENRALRSALERAVDCINGLLARTPVRDIAETLAECAAALNERSGS